MDITIEQRQKVSSVRIGTIENYYGGVSVFEMEGKYFWEIDSPSFSESTIEKIPKYLYDSLLKFEKERSK